MQITLSVSFLFHVQHITSVSMPIHRCVYHSYNVILYFYTMQYLRQRYGSKALLVFGWLCQVLIQVFYSGIVMYAPAVMLEPSEFNYLIIAEHSLSPQQNPSERLNMHFQLGTTVLTA